MFLPMGSLIIIPSLQEHPRKLLIFWKNGFWLKRVTVSQSSPITLRENRGIPAPFTVKKVTGWSDHIQDHLQRSILPQMMDYLNKQGFAKK